MFLKKILKLVLPIWLVTDVYDYFTHPYWRKKTVEPQENIFVKSEGITGKTERPDENLIQADNQRHQAGNRAADNRQKINIDLA